MDTRTIIIQLDVDSDNNLEEDIDILRETTKRNLPIELSKKTHQSPGLNVLDLGYFTSILVLQHNKYNEGFMDLVESVKKS